MRKHRLPKTLHVFFINDDETLTMVHELSQIPNGAKVGIYELKSMSVKKINHVLIGTKAVLDA